MMSVKEICRVTGVTRKTLFYYDRIGLLEPSRRSGKQNFKEYDEQAVNRLLEIRLYREMGLSIPVIQDILEGDENARKQFLEQISKEIHSDIRKRIADAKIIDSLKQLTHEELNEVITETAELERLRSRLLAMSGADPQNES
ncbi:MAG: MerR family transcriptional regulator [Solobacterium sp.]|nr:MerR family transcriptional regulator [Solobacterium sp.]